MTAQNDYDKVIVGFVILAILLILIALSCASNTPSAPVSVVGDAGPIDLTQDSTQVVNSVWPWMIAVIAQPILFLAFLYFSNSWKGRRGL